MPVDRVIAPQVWTDMHESEMKLKMRVRRIKEGRDLRGGFATFSSCFPDVCENKPPCVSSLSLSQPCLPVANLGLTRILPHLYVGSQKDVLNEELMAQHGITYVLNASNTCPKPDFISENCFLRIPVNDSYCEKLLPWLEKSNEFIDKAKVSNCKVIVHCLAGISRSATIVIAYIMKTMGLSSDDAYRFVKDRRPSISPNFNFLGQLLEFERDLKQKTPTCDPLRPTSRQPDKAMEISDQILEKKHFCQRQQEAVVVNVKPPSATSIQRDFSSLHLSTDQILHNDQLKCSFHLDFKSVYSNQHRQACSKAPHMDTDAMPKLFKLDSPKSNRVTCLYSASERSPRSPSPSESWESSIRKSEQKDRGHLERLSSTALSLNLNLNHQAAQDPSHDDGMKSSLFLSLPLTSSSVWTKHRGLAQAATPGTPTEEHRWFFSSDLDPSANSVETHFKRRSCQFEESIVTTQRNEDFGKLRKQPSFSGSMEVIEVS